MSKWPKNRRMYHGWGCCSRHRLSFVTEVENESVLLIALKIFIHLWWRRQPRREGFRVLFYKQERWFPATVDWTEEIELQAGRRRLRIWLLGLSNLSKKKEKNSGKLCWNFFGWLPDVVATHGVLYVSTFWSSEVSWRDKSDWAATLK